MPCAPPGLVFRNTVSIATKWVPVSLTGPRRTDGDPRAMMRVATASSPSSGLLRPCTPAGLPRSFRGVLWPVVRDLPQSLSLVLTSPDSRAAASPWRVPQPPLNRTCPGCRAGHVAYQPPISLNFHSVPCAPLAVTRYAARVQAARSKARATDQRQQPISTSAQAGSGPPVAQ
jgi:hypothetical protein